MKKTGWFLVGILVLMMWGMLGFVTVSNSAQIVIRTPPGQFLVNPNTTWLVVRAFKAPKAQISRICLQMLREPEPIGCTDTVAIGPNREVCTIFLADNYDEQSEAVVMRHQRAHCFGWKHYF